MSNNIGFEDCDKKPLGSGNFGVVYNCGKLIELTKNNGSRYAVKFVANKKLGESEQDILHSLFYDKKGHRIKSAWKNENIVKYYKLSEKDKAFLESVYYENSGPNRSLNSSSNNSSNNNNEKQNIAIFVLELCNMELTDFKYNTLFDANKLDTLNINHYEYAATKKDRVMFDFKWQVFKGLYYLFERRIVHFDIKPDNILVSISDDNTPTYKISDFGFAKKNENPSPTNEIKITSCTPTYAPVLYRKKHFTKYYPLFFTTYARDLYAFFITLTYLFEGKAQSYTLSLYYYGKEYLDTFPANDIQIVKESDIKPINDLDEDGYKQLYKEIDDDYKAEKKRLSEKKNLLRSLSISAKKRFSSLSSKTKKLFARRNSYNNSSSNYSSN